MTKQARIINNIHIMGYGMLKAGEQYDIIKSNKHYVYINLNGCTCRLPVSAAEIVKGQRKDEKAGSLETVRQSKTSG